jgi:hypothetical protein
LGSEGLCQERADPNVAPPRGRYVCTGTCSFVFSIRHRGWAPQGLGTGTSRARHRHLEGSAQAPRGLGKAASRARHKHRGRAPSRLLGGCCWKRRAMSRAYADVTERRPQPRARLGIQPSAFARSLCMSCMPPSLGAFCSTNVPICQTWTSGWRVRCCGNSSAPVITTYSAACAATRCAQDSVSRQGAQKSEVPENFALPLLPWTARQARPPELARPPGLAGPAPSPWPGQAATGCSAGVAMTDSPTRFFSPKSIQYCLECESHLPSRPCLG